jgi:oligopeptide transport system ATP-binding protein
MSEPLLAVRDLAVRYRTAVAGAGTRQMTAVDAVSFELATGESLGLVGESGSGKSSIARALLRLVPASGTVRFLGTDLLTLQGPALRAIREHLQIIFQDPLAALDPRMSVAEIIAEPLREFRPQLDQAQRQQQVLQMMARVGLTASQLGRFPHEFSGGQAQRIGIARALMLAPQLLICDEPVASLDVSIKSQISNLLRDLQQELQLTVLFIAHDLASVRYSCDRVMVLYLGRVMEIAPREQLYSTPRHPYTRALLEAVPVPDPQRQRPLQLLQGEPPSPLAVPSGCAFRNRCTVAIARCSTETPALRPSGAGFVACHIAEG